VGPATALLLEMTPSHRQLSSAGAQHGAGKTVGRFKNRWGPAGFDEKALGAGRRFRCLPTSARLPVFDSVAGPDIGD